MVRRFGFWVAAGLVVMLMAAGAGARAQTGTPGADGDALARFVEQRAAQTSFAELEAFGEAALLRSDREGLNRLYHVTWTILNQGEFERAEGWSRRLALASRIQNDARYENIARLNALTIRYDRGEVAVAAEMARHAEEGRDWFVRAHAARLAALNLIDQGRIGDGLRLLTRAQAEIPDNAPFADTARAGIWEVVGMALKAIDDMEGATAGGAPPGRRRLGFADLGHL